MDKWLSILCTLKNFEATPEVCVKVQPDMYLIDGVNTETHDEELYKVYDCSKNGSEFNLELYRKELKKDENYQFVVVYRNWDHEQDVYWKAMRGAKTAKKKRRLIETFNKSFSMYSEMDQCIELKVDADGINYLEFIADASVKKPVKGIIYNLSFSEIKKLFNVTGSELFKHNVRYGLEDHRMTKELMSAFELYLKKSVYKLILRHNPAEEILQEAREVLSLNEDYDILEDITGPENFWFYHNGISIFSFQEVTSCRDAITINPQHVSVINGAQTISNFFKALEEIKRKILPQIYAIENFEIEIVSDEIIENIFVKTIIIQGDKACVGPITLGLNNQIPIEYTAVVANSQKVEDINKLLKGKIKIRKDGEVVASGQSVTSIEFVKAWLTICGEPGKSKNFDKYTIDGKLDSILSWLNQFGTDDFVGKMALLRVTEQWWIATKKERLEKVLYPACRNIATYGKVYFESFVMLNLSGKELDEALLTVLYEKFEKDVYVLTEGTADFNDFKKDNLFIKLRKLQTASTDVTKSFVFTEQDEVVLKQKLNNQSQNPYTVSKTISHHFNATTDILPYFRVITLFNGKVKEAFPFPNSTFNELKNDTVECDSSKDYKALEYRKSLFKREVERKYPVFLVYRSTEDSLQAEGGQVISVRYISDFTFSMYENKAEIVYEKTAAAFEAGDEYQFPKQSDGLGFHVRTKALNAEDTFEFTNGKFITKRTFWANKETVGKIIDEYSDDTSVSSLIATDATSSKKVRKARTSFDLLGIKKGEVLTFSLDKTITVTVLDGKNNVSFENQSQPISVLAKALLSSIKGVEMKGTVSGWDYFEKEGVILTKLRDKQND